MGPYPTLQEYRYNIRFRFTKFVTIQTPCDKLSASKLRCSVSYKSRMIYPYLDSTVSGARTSCTLLWSCSSMARLCSARISLDLATPKPYL